MTAEVSVEVACVDCDTDLVGTLDGRNVDDVHCPKCRAEELAAIDAAEDRAGTPELNGRLAWAGATPC